MAELRTNDDLQAEIAELRRRLEEAEQTLCAIRQGSVDAVVVDDSRGQRVYSLESADLPYRRLVECMREGAVTLGAEGEVLFCNAHLADLLKSKEDRVIGRQLVEFVPDRERPAVEALLR